MRRSFLPLFPILLLAPVPCAAQERVYQSPQDFLASVFGTVPPPRTLWIGKDRQAAAARILGRTPAQLRQRYWADGGKTAWILEHIGKEEPITAGFVVSDGRLESARVLIYRESRGMEVSLPAFLKQFAGQELTPDYRLRRPIDGISGATLSVWAMDRMARLALYFDRESRQP